MDVRRFVFPGVLGLAAYFAVAEGEYSMLDVRRAEARVVEQEAELPRIRAEIDSLRQRIEALRSDDKALETFARERYGFIREGEYLYRLSEPRDEADPEAGAGP